MKKPSARRRLAENLRIIRLVRNLSQEDLAELASLHRTYISGIERAQRNPSLDQLERLANGLGISIGELFSEPDPDEVAKRVLELLCQAVDGVPPRIREEQGYYAHLWEKTSRASSRIVAVGCGH